MMEEADRDEEKICRCLEGTRKSLVAFPCIDESNLGFPHAIFACCCSYSNSAASFFTVHFLQLGYSRVSTDSESALYITYPMRIRTDSRVACRIPASRALRSAYPHLEPAGP